MGRLVVGVGAVHGPAKGGPATGRNPTAREGAPASPKGLKARSPVRQRAGLPAPTPASAGLNLVGRNENQVGDVSGFAPPGDIHRVHNTGDTTAISIHVYGTDVSRVGSSARRCYH